MLILYSTYVVLYLYRFVINAFRKYLPKLLHLSTMCQICHSIHSHPVWLLNVNSQTSESKTILRVFFNWMQKNDVVRSTTTESWLSRSKVVTNSDLHVIWVDRKIIRSPNTPVSMVITDDRSLFSSSICFPRTLNGLILFIWWSILDRFSFTRA